MGFHGVPGKGFGAGLGVGFGDAGEGGGGLGIGMGGAVKGEFGAGGGIGHGSKRRGKVYYCHFEDEKCFLESFSTIRCGTNNGCTGWEYCHLSSTNSVSCEMEKNPKFEFVFEIRLNMTSPSVCTN